MIEGAARRLVEALPVDGLVLVEGGVGASTILADALDSAGDALGELTFSGVQIPGVNRRIWLPNARARFETFFMTPELAARRDRVTFLPLTYTQILRHLRDRPIAAALFSVSPPDADGRCSFGPTVDFLADLWPRIPIRIAHVNPSLPRTAGPTGIPHDAFLTLADIAQPLIAIDDAAPDERTRAIASNVAALIGDGATLQLGIGKLPGAVLRDLRGRRGLGIHSGLIGDGVLDLLDSGAIAGGDCVTTGVAIGTKRLYDALPDSGIIFRPVSYTHDWATIARQPDFVAINSAVEVDLFGQGYSETVAGSWSSGTGGATDFARGAMLGGGLRIVALPASARGTSRIVAPGAGHGPVTLARGDVDFVVTEHGAADLRGLTHDARAAALIAIADPGEREPLARAWRDGLSLRQLP